MSVRTDKGTVNLVEAALATRTLYGATKFGAGRRGQWLRPGAQSSNPMSPGSYARYVLVRPPPRSYGKTEQQAAIGAAGRAVGKECKGKTGSEFYSCRRDILSAVRKTLAEHTHV